MEQHCGEVIPSIRPDWGTEGQRQSSKTVYKRKGRISASSSTLKVLRVAPWNRNIHQQMEQMEGVISQEGERNQYPSDGESSSSSTSAEIYELESGTIDTSLSLSFSCLICGLCPATKLDLLVHISTSHQYSIVNDNGNGYNDMDIDSNGNMDNIQLEGKKRKYSDTLLENMAAVNCNIFPRVKPVSVSLSSSGSSSLASCSPEKEVFSCKDCLKTFSHRGSLKSHQDSIHAGKKPFKCQHAGCGKRFARKLTLTRHTQVHTGEKPFECHICLKKLSRKHILKQHMLTHFRS